jgi:hypothetical protein
MNPATEDQARARRVRTEQAIQFAMQSRWDDAITANRAIIAAFPKEADAYNRLGKALSETGKIKEAREAYQQALEIEPTNQIARRNLDRLASMKGKAEPDRAQQVDTSLFIEEMGKTGVSTLKPANMKMLATLSAGDEVALKSIGSRLTVETIGGDAIGDVEPKLAMRLNKLITGGNKYAAAVTGLGEDTVRVIIKETFQHPTQVGRLSFPAGKAGDVIRPYTKESMVRSDMDDEDESGDESDEWDDTEPDAEAEPREVNIFDVARDEDADEPEFEE